MARMPANSAAYDSPLDINLIKFQTGSATATSNAAPAK